MYILHIALLIQKYMYWFDSHRFIIACGLSSRAYFKTTFGVYLSIFLGTPLSVLDNIHKGMVVDISHFEFGKQNIYLINHPDYIKDVLVTYNSNFIKSRGLQLARRVLGESTFIHIIHESS